MWAGPEGTCPRSVASTGVADPQNVLCGKQREGICPPGRTSCSDKSRTGTKEPSQTFHTIKNVLQQSKHKYRHHIDNNIRAT